MDFKSNFQDITLDSDFFKRCNIFISLLQQWGKVHNLTGRLSKEDIEENIIDSVYPLKFIDSFDSFADIGTGAGYPGFIIAMARSDVKTYLIEPRLKRVSFLNFVKNTLGLNNIEIIGKRVEDIEDLKVDLITSRAVTNTKLLLDITKKISKENSSYLFYKGTLLEEEIKDAKLENCEVFSRKDRNYLYLKGLK